MEQVTQVLQAWNSLGYAKYILILIIAFYFVGIIVSRLYANKTNKALEEWLEQNPNASKIHYSDKTGIFTSGRFHIDSVDGEQQVKYFLTKAGIPAGMYLNPGSHVVEITYEHTRPGILHKRVTTTYGPSKIGIEVEAKKIYEIVFDKKNKEFKFNERA